MSNFPVYFYFIGKSKDYFTLIENLHSKTLSLVSGYKLFEKVSVNNQDKVMILHELIDKKIISTQNQELVILDAKYLIENSNTIDKYFQNSFEKLEFLISYNNFLKMKKIDTKHSFSEISLVLTGRSQDLKYLNSLDTFATIYNIILKANKDLWIYVAYGDSEGIKLFKDALKTKYNQGVNIKFLIRKENYDSFRTILEFLPVTAFKFHKSPENQNFPTHAKVILSDDNLSYIGSANFNFNSMTNNLEIGVKVEDKDFNSKLKLFLMKVWRENSSV